MGPTVGMGAGAGTSARGSVDAMGPVGDSGASGVGAALRRGKELEGEQTALIPSEGWQRHPYWRLCDVLVRRIERLGVPEGSLRRRFWRGVAGRVVDLVLPANEGDNVDTFREADRVLLEMVCPVEYAAFVRWRHAGGGWAEGGNVEGWAARREEFLERMRRSGRGSGG